MNPRVEAFIKEVKLTDEGISKALNEKFGTDKERFSYVAQAQLQKVLNHPDIALIFKCERCVGRRISPSDCSLCHGTGIIPISLAEALKEDETKS